MMILKRRGRLFLKSDLLNFSPKTDKISLPPLAGSYLSATLESSKKKKDNRRAEAVIVGGREIAVGRGVSVVSGLVGQKDNV